MRSGVLDEEPITDFENKNNVEPTIEELRKEQQLLQSKRDSDLASIFSSKNVNFPDKAKKAFVMEYGDSLAQEGGEWYVQSGDEVVSLSDAADSFLKTDFGSSFIKPTKGRGLGMKPAANNVPAGKDAKPVLNQTLFNLEG